MKRREKGPDREKEQRALFPLSLPLAPSLCSRAFHLLTRLFGLLTHCCLQDVDTIFTFVQMAELVAGWKRWAVRLVVGWLQCKVGGGEGEAERKEDRGPETGRGVGGCAKK